MNIEVIRYRLPVYWACALINDDYTGLCKEECQEIKNFLNIADGYPVDVDWETEVESRAMLLFDLLEKKILTPDGLNLKEVDRRKEYENEFE